MMNPLWGTQTCWPETSENIWNVLWQSQSVSSLFWACKHSQRRFCSHVGFSDLIKTPWIDVIMYVTCLWADIVIWRTKKKSFNFKLLWFQIKARYRPENMQADTFLECLISVEDKNAKFCLLWLYDFTWKFLSEHVLSAPELFGNEYKSFWHMNISWSNFWRLYVCFNTVEGLIFHLYMVCSNFGKKIRVTVYVQVINWFSISIFLHKSVNTLLTMIFRTMG